MALLSSSIHSPNTVMFGTYCRLNERVSTPDVLEDNGLLKQLPQVTASVVLALKVRV